MKNWLKKTRNPKKHLGALERGAPFLKHPIIRSHRHQGVKGLEFDRVLVIMDDSEARGFLFSYEKLLGAKPPTNGDLRKIDEGAEIGPDRTRRLLYVTCTRAERSLALMAYTNDPDLLETAVIQQGWFELSEIERL